MDWNKCIMHYNTLTYRVHICGYKLHLDCLIKGRNLHKVKWCAAQQPCTLSIVPDNRISSEPVHHNLYPNFPCHYLHVESVLKSFILNHPPYCFVLFFFVFSGLASTSGVCWTTVTSCKLLQCFI